MNPLFCTIDGSDLIYFSYHYGVVIINNTEFVSLIGGNSTEGISMDGYGTNASFNSPSGLEYDHFNHMIYIIDNTFLSNNIRTINTNKTNFPQYEVKTPFIGSANGFIPSDLFYDIVIDTNHEFIYLSASTNEIFRINVTSWLVIEYAGTNCKLISLK